MIIILRPGFEGFNPGCILPLVAALAYALVQIIAGKMSEKEKASSMAFYIQLILLPFAVSSDCSSEMGI